MSNRYVNALVKTGITAAALHVVFLIAGFILGDKTGWFHLPMIWPHWEDGISIIISLVLAVALYCGIYAFCTDPED